MHRYPMQKKLIYLNTFVKLVNHWKIRKIFNKTVLRFVDQLGCFFSHFGHLHKRWFPSMSSWHCERAAWYSYHRLRYISNRIGGQGGWHGCNNPRPTTRIHELCKEKLPKPNTLSRAWFLCSLSRYMFKP